ncbi:transposase [Sphingomonas sp. BAUL-RG-20F-R05-02]|uniref:transposase n=1 Tax=Sphingomonas sp. BAUL-RG-20F-R05-02 TaxID=2914830 RepID=UPI00391F1C67
MTASEWAIIAPLVPKRGIEEGVGLNWREVLDAIFSVLRAGCPWRFLPDRFSSVDAPSVASGIWRF